MKFLIYSYMGRIEVQKFAILTWNFTSSFTSYLLLLLWYLVQILHLLVQVQIFKKDPDFYLCQWRMYFWLVGGQPTRLQCCHLPTGTYKNFNWWVRKLLVIVKHTDNPQILSNTEFLLTPFQVLVCSRP